MDEIERYLFDTQGFLVLPDLLSAEQVRRLLAAIPRDPSGRVRDRSAPADAALLDYPEPLFRDLIDHPAILPRLAEILSSGRDHGQHAQPFYLTHWYQMSLLAGEPGPCFHNGGTPFDPLCSYAVRDGRIFSGLTAVLWALTDAGPGDGGFWCIPGSHKAGFPLPTAIERYELVPDCAVQPVLRAGSAVIFTEALTHGTRPWRAAHERIALFYKYEPAHLVFPLEFERTAAWIASLPARHQRYLRPSPGRTPPASR